MLREAHRRRATVAECVMLGTALGVLLWAWSALQWIVVDWVRDHHLQNPALIVLVAAGVCWCLRQR